MTSDLENWPPFDGEHRTVAGTMDILASLGGVVLLPSKEKFELFCHMAGYPEKAEPMSVKINGVPVGYTRDCP